MATEDDPFSMSISISKRSDKSGRPFRRHVIIGWGDPFFDLRMVPFLRRGVSGGSGEKVGGQTEWKWTVQLRRMVQKWFKSGRPWIKVVDPKWRSDLGSPRKWAVPEQTVYNSKIWASRTVYFPFLDRPFSPILGEQNFVNRSLAAQKSLNGSFLRIVMSVTFGFLISGNELTVKLKTFSSWPIRFSATQR